MPSPRPFNLSHAAAKPPTGSPAGEALISLRREGYDIIQNPTFQSELTEQFIGREYGPETYDWARTSAESRQAYTYWRDGQPERSLFALSDQLGMLAAAGWIGPRRHSENGPVASVTAVGGIRLYDGNADVAKRFLQVTHAYAFRRYSFVRQGILMPVSTLPLIQACTSIGYEPISRAGDQNSRNQSLDMVVSSGPLQALNIGTAPTFKQPMPQRTPEKPRLRLIQGDMGD